MYCIHASCAQILIKNDDLTVFYAVKLSKVELELWERT